MAMNVLLARSIDVYVSRNVKWSSHNLSSVLSSTDGQGDQALGLNCLPEPYLHVAKVPVTLFIILILFAVTLS